MSAGQAFLLFLILLALVAGGLRLVARQVPVVAFPVLLAAAGVLLGLLPGVPLPRIGPDLILLVFVPGVVFEAALGLNLAEVRRHLLPIGLLATVGVLLTVVLIGALTHWALGLPWSDAILLGAILAATDPIAVVALLRRMRAAPGVAAILEGESLFNDGTGVAIFAAVLASILAGTASVGDAAVRFALITLVGAAIGVAAAALGVLLLRRSDDPELEILVTLALAYGSYLAADLAHASGVVAVVAAGVVVARYGRVHGTQLLGFWLLVGFVLNAIVFVLVGTALPTRALLNLLPSVLVVYLVMVATRAVPVYLLLGIADPRLRAIPWSWRHLVFWGGIRGALGVALALSVAGRPGVGPAVSTLAYGAVLLSLFIQGGLLRPLAGRLGLSGDPRSAPPPAPRLPESR